MQILNRLFSSPALVVPPLVVPPPAAPKAMTAATPAEALQRLRSLHDAEKGWRARVNARRAEIAELTPRDPNAALEINDEVMGEVSRLRLQVEMGESAIARIEDDSHALIGLAVEMLEVHRTKAEAAIDQRLAAVESKAREIVRGIFPAERIDQAIGLLPVVRLERGIAYELKMRANARVSMVSSGGKNPIPVPRSDVTGGIVVYYVDMVAAVAAEAEARLSLPISFTIEGKSNGNGNHA